MRVAFVTNICPHYRVKTFETLTQYHDINYYFFSAGDEWYWLREHGVRAGEFKHEYLPGFRIGQTRFTPTLPWKLWGTEYDTYIKCINGRFALPLTYLIARARRRPFILWTGIWTRIQTPAHRLFFPITRFIYHHSNAIVTYGNHVKRYLMNEGVPSDNIFVAAHAVDNSQYNREVSEVEKIALRKKLCVSNDNKIVLFLGRLEPVKGLSYLMDAFASLERNEDVLVIAGTGSGRKALEAMADSKGISERVRFTGYVQPEKTVAYYALAHVLVLPSVTVPSGKELWGLVVNEAFNQGIPAITTNAVGAAAGGLVQDGVNGFIVPERDSQSLGYALQRILDDYRLRERMSQNARQTIETWNNERMVLGFRRAIEYASDKV